MKRKTNKEKKNFRNDLGERRRNYESWIVLIL